MSPSRHGISIQQWLEFVDNTLPARERVKIRSHADACEECGKLLQGLSAWHDAILEDGKRLKEVSRWSPVQIDTMLAKTLERIRSLEPGESRSTATWNVTQGTILLRCLMTQFGGAGTARAAIDVALRHAGVRPGERVSPLNWRCFVDNLSEAFASVCGREAGRLIGCAGLGLSAEWSR